ncbi:non-canonical poly(A) RNA polymerase PAPD5/7, partial [Tremellales sp. Uapishka_1]
MSALTAFQTGDEFIGFDKSPSPAGPSRLPPVQPAVTSKSQSKGKGKRNSDGIEYRNLKEERKASERKAPWADKVHWDRCRDPAEMLNEEIIAFHTYMSPTKEEYEIRLYVIQLINDAILKVWPEAEISPFGSWQTQLYLPTGDIDLVVSTSRYTDHAKNKLLSELARAMRQAYITDVVAIISKAKVPIIKFVTSEGKLNVDISLNQTNGIAAGKIMNHYLDVLKGSRELVLVVKAFLSQRSMNEVFTGGIGSYAVICMVVNFLQVHPKLRRSELDPMENLGTLLIEFFELYGRNFNYDEVGISIRKGGFYFNKRSRGWIWNNQPFLLSIEDPQDKDNDISKGSFGIRQVKMTLAGAYDLLQAKLFERSAQLSGSRSGRLSRDVDPEEMSILAGVMGVTKETLKHRAEIKNLHSEGRLQRMLGVPIVKGLSDSHPFGGSTPKSVSKPKSSPEPTRHQRFASHESDERPRSNAVQAITVDDTDEVGDGLDDSYDYQEELSEAEDGEIEEIAAMPKQSVLRFDSVSVDANEEEEDWFKERKAENELYGKEDDEDSRYRVATPRGKKGKGKGKAKKLVSDSESEAIDSDESESEDRPHNNPFLKKPPAVSKATKKARRDFWAKKAGRKDDVELGNDDFVAL